MNTAARKVSVTRKNAHPAALIACKSNPEFSTINGAVFQARSRVSSPNDAAEHEADATASQVMRMHVPSNSIGFVPTGNGGVFRQVTEEPDKDKVSARLESPYIARFADVPVIGKGSNQRLNRQVPEEEVQRQPQEKEVRRQVEDEEIQRQPEEEEVQRQVEDEEVQRQPEEEEVQRQVEDEEIQRQPEEEEVQRQVEEEEVQCQSEEEKVQRQPEEDVVQRKADDNKELPGNVAAEIRNAKSGGTALPLSVRKFMEPRFETNFSNVRIHADERASHLNKQISAKAFATGNHIFFADGQFQPETDDGKELLAHELTHTIQQGAAVQRKEAAPRVSQQTSSGNVQRLGISDALDYFADKANYIPGFRMFTIVLGVNPINMAHIDRSPGNILRAMIEFIPGGAFITQALDNHGVFDRVSVWAAQQIETLGMVGSSIRAAINRFLDSLGWRDIFDLGDVWQRAKAIFTGPIDRIKRFASGLISGIIRIVKEVILRPLGQLAKSTIGEQNYSLLTAVLGYDPITGDAVPRSAELIIGGFMRLIGQEEVWSNLQRSNAIPRAWAWFQGTLAGVIGFVTGLPGKFLKAFQALTIEDIILIPRAIVKVIGVFGGYVGNFISWAGSKVLGLLQIIFEVVAPGAVPFIRRAAGAFRAIIQNPISFVGNLVRAGRRGFQKFAANFLSHLKASMIGWITGTMAGTGVYIPQGFNLREIVRFVLSVMGLTWQNIRGKLVRVVGETAVGAMERGFEIVKTLVTEGPAAAWRQIVESITNLKEMVMEQIMNFVVVRVVQAAITKLVSSLNPAGAFIQAILAIYNTIMFFVERLRQIGQVVASFVNSIAAIAAGNVGRAAARVERTLAGMLTLVVSFLARFAGLGKVSDAVKNIINRIREPIDKALDKVVAWIVRQARRLGRFVAQAGVPQDPNERLALASRAAIGVARRMRGSITQPLLSVALRGISARYGLTSIEPFERGGTWWIRASINPVLEESTGEPVSSNGATSTDTQGSEANQVLIQAHVGKKVVNPDNQELTSIGRAASTALSTAYSFVKQNEKYHIRRKTASNATQIIHIDDAGILKTGTKPGSSSGTHTNYIPTEKTITEHGGSYVIEYKSLNDLGQTGPTFKIDISYEQALNASGNETETRFVSGRNLKLKESGGARGATQSATAGFHNAHLIADRFGGSGRNTDMNIHPSSPNYNTATMKNKEDAIAAAARAENTDNEFDLEVGATLKGETADRSALKAAINAEARRDNTIQSQEINEEMANQLVILVRNDIKGLPGKFMSVSYTLKAEGNVLYREGIGADPGYAALVKKLLKG